MKKLIDNRAKFFSLGKVTEVGAGSSVEGLNLIFPYLYPFILPKSFYNGEPEKPVLTIAIPDILVARSDLDNTTVYEVAEALTENKSQLIQYDNIYNLLDKDYGNQQFSFPFHTGAKKYLDRDKPSIWTQYAKIIWPFVSMLALLIGALASVHNRIRQRKKIRIETLYFSLLKIRQQAFDKPDEVEKNRLMEEMQRLRSSAFDALMHNKLVANESFSIFLNLYHEVVQEINSKR
jgi:hypothetical protein